MKAPLRCGVLAAAAALLAVPAAAAATLEPPMTLPGDAAAASVSADRATWIVGARPSAAARALAARFGADPLGPAGTGGYAVATGRARAFAAALLKRALLVYAQPNTRSAILAGVPDDPLSKPPDAWRAVVADPALTPPVPTPASPLIALVDSQLDATHPEFAGGNVTTINRFAVNSEHGTATAAVAAAPVNGRGIVGVWPGARALNVPLPGNDFTCRDSANAIGEAINTGAAVINMSYGSSIPCYPEYVALQAAVARGIVPVAAAGNEGDQANPLEYPASLPHVLTVAAVGPNGKATGFSNENAAVDLSAPGVAIMTAVPLAFDTEPPADGYMRMSGTSFSTPMVSAAVAWLRQERSDLTAAQAAQAIRLSAQDVGRNGWEGDTGFGVLSVANARAFKRPPKDTAEPNDDILWVDGRAFGRPAALTFTGKGHATRRGLVDVFEDPADVYRIRVRGHRRVRITARPTGRHDDVALRVYRRKAMRIGSRPYRRSLRKGHKTERIVLRNRGRRDKTYYVAVKVQGTRLLDATYALRVG
jgi:Subtilase family